MKLLYIKWEDHFGNDDCNWKHYDPNHVPTPVTVESVGWVLYETPKLYCIVPHAYLQEDGTVTGTGEMCILKSCVVTKRSLSTKPKRK